MKINLEDVKEIYGEDLLYEIKDNIDDVTSNMSYLFKLGFKDVYDIIKYNPYMFIQEENYFKKQIDDLIRTLGTNYIDILNNDISLWGNIE